MKTTEKPRAEPKTDRRLKPAPRAKKNWTPEEDAFLQDKWGSLSIPALAKKLGRSVEAINNRRRRLGCGAHLENDYRVSLSQLMNAYSYTPVGGLIPLSKVWMQNTITVHAWTGAEEKTDVGSEASPEEMVYVTESGTVYHRNPGCRYLRVSLQQVAGSRIASMRNTYGAKYYPCESCSRNQNPAGCVYITSTGNRYHNQETCSGLKRTIRLVKLSQVEDMHACSSCG